MWRRVRTAVAAAARERRAGPGARARRLLHGRGHGPRFRDRAILGPSLLMIDNRGEEYLPRLEDALGVEEIYRINGNILGTQYSLPKLMWLRDNTPEVYNRAWKFLLWSGFVSFMLGAEPCVDHSLASRTLLYDVDARAWSPRIADAAGIDLEKLPAPVAAGTRIGSVSAAMADELGLQTGTPIIAGTHDQCANAVGCGVIDEGPRHERHGHLPLLRPGVHGAEARRRPWSAGACAPSTTRRRGGSSRSSTTRAGSC